MKNSTKVLIAISGVLLLIIIFALSLVGTYNGMVTQREAVNASFKNIDTQLQRRADLIPNLVSTVKGFAAQEKDIMANITDARAKLAGAQTVGQKATADNELNGALSRLLVVVENYPNLKSDAIFIQLTDDLAGTENRIAVSRTDYNNTVKSYNTKIKRFPTNIFANTFGFKEAEYFEASPESKIVPQVSFGK